MKYYLSTIKDVLGNNYIGIIIPKYEIQPYLSDLEEELGDEFDTYFNNQQKRDDNSYHLTVINVMEYNTLIKNMGIDNFANYTDKIFDVELLDLKFLGIGKAVKNENTSYFIVAESNLLEQMLKDLNLPTKDFHITIGFKYKDVFGVTKNTSTIIKKKSKFLNIIKKLYNRFENCDFLSSINNINPAVDINNIKIINLTDFSIKFLSGNLFSEIGLDDNDNLRVFIEYEISNPNDYKQMSTVDISNILNGQK
jgi:hypothetical protein